MNRLTVKYTSRAAAVATSLCYRCLPRSPLTNAFRSFSVSSGTVGEEKTTSATSATTTPLAAPKPAAKPFDYKTDTQTLARWLDVSIVKRKGRAFDADSDLLHASSKEALQFPTIKGVTLSGQQISVPGDLKLDGKVKLVCFSCKHYGFTLVRSWMDTFVQGYLQEGKSKNIDEVVAIEICFVEYGFLSMAHTLFASSLKSQVLECQREHTVLSFGGLMDFAAALELPNKYTGYAYLLDKNNQVRWRGSGQALNEELETLVKCVEKLRLEGKPLPSTAAATAASAGQVKKMGSKKKT